ncbi:GNAT family N-acetyltransferase [Maridesulfovibrio zosterae]|uniref:GNAT family N-acetyltransferase n=1 Tax=Maridesulfovibrio zosterae TaxID=82171 RepID=UPI0003F76B7F|nr:GNAT family N-acetyltransferase [Maridesulfovibrio zosterae]
MNKAVQITEYKKKHAQEVLNLIVSIQKDEYNLPITASDQPDLMDIENFYQTNSGNFWVAEHDSQVVGTLSLLDIGNKEGAMRKMFVAPSYRGMPHKVAKQLLEILLSWAKEKDFKNIYLGTTTKFMAAQKFYKKNGFDEILKTELPSNFPIVKVDTIFYNYKL